MVAEKKGQQLPLSVDQFLAKAREITGINSIDHDAIEPFSVLYNSYNNEVPLNDKNAKFVENYLLRFLCNRLRMQRDFAAHPEIADQKIKAPIFVCGMARTGSTKMQKLLASSEDFNWLPFWQSLNPCLYTGSRDESPEARIQDTDNFVKLINEASPAVKFTHEYKTHEPEEECWTMMHSLRAPLAMGITHMPSYMQWVAGIDTMRYQMEYLRDSLKYLQWQGLANPEKRWLLKAPQYFGYEPTMRSIFPDASFVMTHRHPKQTVASLCSFLDAILLPVTDKKGDPSLYITGAEMQVNQHLAIRKSTNTIAWCDVFYKELTDSVETVAKKVYQFCHAELSESSLQRMVDWDKAHPIHAKGGHSYSLEDFGVTEVQINQQFSGYINLMKELFGESIV